MFVFGASNVIKSVTGKASTPVASGGFVISSIIPALPPKVIKPPCCVLAGFILKTLPLSNAMLPKDMVAEPVKFKTPVIRLALAASGRLTIAINPNAKKLFIIDNSSS
jgi:hypothetical protein